MAASMAKVVGRLSNFRFGFKRDVRLHLCRRSSQQASEVSEEAVEYPEIVPKYPPGNWSHGVLSPKRAWNFHNEGQELLEKADVRERLEAIAGDKDKAIHIIKSWDMTPGTLAFKQYITRTHIVTDRLPDAYSHTAVSDDLYQRLKPLLVDTILQEHEHRIKDRQKADSEKAATMDMVGSVLNVVLAGCGLDTRHLLTAQYDREVRVETFWSVGGYDSSLGGVWLGQLDYQYRDNAQYLIRTEKPLPEFVSPDHELCQNGDYPQCDYHPRLFAQKVEAIRPISISGHWIGDPCEFIHTGVKVPGFRFEKFCELQGKHPEMVAENWLQCGLTSSFAACVAQAHNQGFNKYFDATYPFTTQTLLCLNNTVQLFAYQLNTFHLWKDPKDNVHNNVLWVSPKLQLYDSVENGEIRGANDDAFKLLLRCLLLETADRGYDLRPYLSESSAPVEKTIFINKVGEDKLEVPKIGRYQYPRKSVYF